VKPNYTHSWYLIANPTAGHGTAQKQIANFLTILTANDIKFELVKTSHRNHAFDLVKEGIEKGFRKIIALGGDGTNNEVVNGIMLQTEVLTQDITYCLFPVGTGNDWIKEHQIPINLNQWIEMLKTENTFLQDIGLVKYYKNGEQQQRYFANVAGMAYDAYVCGEMDKLKRPLRNRLAYLFFGLYYVFKYTLQKARVHFNGKTIEDYFYLINAGICRFSGGGMQFVPHAIPNDGKLALTLAGRLSKIGVLLNSYRFYNGKIAGHPKVNTFQTDQIKVEAVDQPILIEVDGELLGETPVEISIIPKALRIVVQKN
jgi:YegS/Rv2252/BmrU family lipid kinase